jgi:hypothetical protein
MGSIISAVAAGLLLAGGITDAALADPGQKGKNRRVMFASSASITRRDTGACRPACRRSTRAPDSCRPGWQKKREPFPVALERRLASLPTGYQRGVIDGHAVIDGSRSHVIFDVAVLF